MRAGLIALVAALGLGGCASAPSGPMNCPTTFVIDVSPSTGAVGHASAAPGNQVVFTDTGNSTVPGQPAGTGCIVSNIMSSVMWKSSDAVNVQLSIPTTAPGGQTVTATCVGATDGPVTITATQYAGGLNGTGTATLTCQ